jgi:hypothetical protein
VFFQNASNSLRGGIRIMRRIFRQQFGYQMLTIRQDAMHVGERTPAINAELELLRCRRGAAAGHGGSRSSMCRMMGWVEVVVRADGVVTVTVAYGQMS